MKFILMFCYTHFHQPSFIIRCYDDFMKKHQEDIFLLHKEINSELVFQLILTLHFRRYYYSNSHLMLNDYCYNHQVVSSSVKLPKVVLYKQYHNSTTIDIIVVQMIQLSRFLVQPALVIAASLHIQN